MQFAEDLKLENNRTHRDVVDAMIRQPHTTAVLPFKSLQPGTNRLRLRVEQGGFNLKALTFSHASSP